MGEWTKWELLQQSKRGRHHLHGNVVVWKGWLLSIQYFIGIEWRADFFRMGNCCFICLQNELIQNHKGLQTLE